MLYFVCFQFVFKLRVFVYTKNLQYELYDIFKINNTVPRGDILERSKNREGEFFIFQNCCIILRKMDLIFRNTPLISAIQLLVRHFYSTLRISWQTSNSHWPLKPQKRTQNLSPLSPLTHHNFYRRPLRAYVPLHPSSLPQWHILSTPLSNTNQAIKRQPTVLAPPISMSLSTIFESIYPFFRSWNEKKKKKKGNYLRIYTNRRLRRSRVGGAHTRSSTHPCQILNIIIIYEADHNCRI